MRKRLGIRGRVELDDDVDVREVKTTRGNVCGEEDAWR